MTDWHSCPHPKRLVEREHWYKAKNEETIQYSCTFCGSVISIVTVLTDQVAP